MRVTALLFMLLLATPARADEPSIRLEHRAQLWVMSTFGAEAQVDRSGGLEEVDPRADLFVRRGRIRLAGELPARLSFLVQLQYDGLAQDPGTLGLTSGRGPVDLQVRDAYATWDMVEDRLALTAGFFHPKLSREAETSGFSVLSFAKSDLQTYVREHAMGQNSGRVGGLQLEGQVPMDRAAVTATLGAFDPNALATSGNGLLWSPLLTGRLQFTRGAEGAAQKPFARRNGLTVALDGSWQGRTELFDHNATFGGDLALRIGAFAFVTEGHGLLRDDALAYVLMARAAWAIPMGERFLQPVVTFTRYDGEPGSALSGTQTSVEAAVFALLTDKAKVGVAVNWSQGNADSLFTDGVTFRRGPWVAVGVQHAM